MLRCFRIPLYFFISSNHFILQVFDFEEPLFGGPENNRFMTALAMRVVMAVCFLRHQVIRFRKSMDKFLVIGLGFVTRKRTEILEVSGFIDTVEGQYPILVSDFVVLRTAAGGTMD